MMTVRKTDHLTLTGWSIGGALATIAITKALTALVVSLPIAWLVNRVFAAGAIRAIFGADRLSYWRCVGLFAIWFAARAKIKRCFRLSSCFTLRYQETLSGSRK